MIIIYRKAEKKDISAISDICFRTGYMGESLESRKIFQDRRLFALIFALYYPIYEPEHCFVACNELNRAIGYIIGTADTVNQEKKFSRHMHWRILLRLLGVTWWRYPASLREFIHWIKNLEKKSPGDLHLLYPAHLHMNILPEYQGKGLGGKLITLFIDHIKDLQVSGIHLGTSNHNRTAISFYRKMGFTAISDHPAAFWSDVEDYREITFGIKL